MCSSAPYQLWQYLMNLFPSKHINRRFEVLLHWIKVSSNWLDGNILLQVNRILQIRKSYNERIINGRYKDID